MNSQPTVPPLHSSLVKIIHTYLLSAELESLKHETLMGSMTIKSHVSFLVEELFKTSTIQTNVVHRYVCTYSKSVFVQEEKKNV